MVDAAQAPGCYAATTAVPMPLWGRGLWVQPYQASPANSRCISSPASTGFYSSIFKSVNSSYLNICPEAKKLSLAMQIFVPQHVGDITPKILNLELSMF